MIWIKIHCLVHDSDIDRDWMKQMKKGEVLTKGTIVN